MNSRRSEPGTVISRTRARFAAAARTGLAAAVALAMPPAPAQPAARAGATDFSAFKIIVDRNIFDPNRRPRVVAADAPKIVDWFALTGTFSYGKGSFAVFDGSGSDYHKVLEPGGTIAGYTLTNIGQTAATLISGTNRVKLNVGMQMRRNEDGKWEAGAASESAGQTYASASGNGLLGRSAGESGRFHSNRTGARTEFRAGSVADAAPPARPGPEANSLAPEQAPGGNPQLDAAGPPSETAGGESDDPVARMMRRRQLETGGNENTNPNQ
jgi:hypothetical protein